MPKNIKCKNCVNLRHDWCEKAVDSPVPDMERDCYYYKAATNADRLRAMTDIELAKWICRVHGSCPSFCPMSDDCDGEDCDGAWLDWLKHEVDNG